MELSEPFVNICQLDRGVIRGVRRVGNGHDCSSIDGPNLIAMAGIQLPLQTNTVAGHSEREDPKRESHKQKPFG